LFNQAKNNSNVRVDNLQQKAAFHFAKYAAFFEKRIRLRTRLRGTRRKQKYTGADIPAFSREKSFSPFPGSPLPLSGTARILLQTAQKPKKLHNSLKKSFSSLDKLVLLK
ncbi:MAG: hypothetical protein IKC05_10175, partial [Lentisphaeria bacterium]|nr:hypothetical protein [Lentisphaeria bacterium]